MYLIRAAGFIVHLLMIDIMEDSSVLYDQLIM